MKAAAIAGTLSTALGWAYLQHIRLPKGPSRLSWQQLVFGHRGCRHIAGIPENTLPAFGYANENAANGIELDVRLCKTGELVVHHDAFVAPLCDPVPGVIEPSAAIADLTREQVKMLRYAADPSKTIEVPLLEEAVDYCREHFLKMLIEIKDVGSELDKCVARVIELYRRHPNYMFDHTTVISFNPKVLYKLRQREPRIAVCMLTCKTLVSDLVQKPTEKVPPLWRLCPRVFDFGIHWMCNAIAPWVIGASMVGPRFSEMTEPLQARWNRRGVLVYLWGFKEPTDCPDWMRRPGVFVAVDDKHVQYFPK